MSDSRRLHNASTNVTAPDPLLDALRALGAAFVGTPPDLRQVARLSRFVNGRGQLLEGGGRVAPDASDAVLTLLYSPDQPREVQAAIDALRAEPVVVKNAHHCINDGGAAYIQAPDLDEAALKSYLLTPLLRRYVERYPERMFDSDAWDLLVEPVVKALRGADVLRTLTTPLLGLRLYGEITFRPGHKVRPATEDERQGWSEDASFERSIARDILVAEAVVEVSYQSRWGGARRGEETGINVATFDADGVADALDSSSLMIALLRLVTGRQLPLVFTQDQIDDIPWARNRFFHRPTQRHDSEVRRIAALGPRGRC